MKAAAQSMPTPAEIRDELQRVVDEKDLELTKLKNALAWLSSSAPMTEQPKPQRQPASKPDRQAKKSRAPKKSKKPAKATRTTTRRAAADDDAPRARKGHVPRVGVEQLYCSELKERQAKTTELKAEGYRRIGPGEPLTAGTYDVRPSGDEDESCVVLWRAKAEADGE